MTAHIRPATGNDLAVVQDIVRAAYTHYIARLARKPGRSEEHTSELQSLMRLSYAVFCLKKKKSQHTTNHNLQKIPTNKHTKQYNNDITTVRNRPLAIDIHDILQSHYHYALTTHHT